MLRYWVFLALAYLIGVGGFVYYSTLHALFSSISASAGLIGPRYLVAVLGLYYLTGFVLAVVFLGFDVRARDVREGIVEVLDSRPLTNLELVAGRFLGLFLSSWIPVVVLALVIEGLGALLTLLGSPIGRTVEPWSLVTLVLLMGVPAVAFVIGLVFVVTLLVRHRLVAALVSIAALVALYWMMFTLPGTRAAFVDFIGVAQVGTPSDVIPSLLVPGGWLQRAGVLVIALGLVGFAAVAHPRLDGGRRVRPAAGAAALVVLGGACLAVVVGERAAVASRIDHWHDAHAARAGEPIPDLVSVTGSVEIDPGRGLDAELELELGAPADAALTRALFTLNPGFAIDEVSAADGGALAAEHADGQLTIELGRTLEPGERTTVRLAYGGRPDTNFGYLDSALDLERINLNTAQIGLLGYMRGIFDADYVALMPGIRWLPASGVDVGRDDPRARRTDFFTLALDVELPDDWLAAGPGRRQTLDGGDGRARFRFAPEAGVPEVALMAGRFERFATDVDGITFEVLVHPAHDANFEILADARGEIEQWIAERLDTAAATGLDYPFDAFTVVEVPNTLRGFAGGWRLDTALAPPAMMLLRETSFPTARFDIDFLDWVGARDTDVEGGQPRIDRDRLISFFSNDFSGGNLFTGAARSFFAHRTSAYGPDGLALDFALEEFATLLVSGQRGYFSAHMFTNINEAATTVVNQLVGQGAASVADAVIGANTRRADVWETALATPLSDIDPAEDPQRTIDTLTLKGGEMAQAVYDTLGPDAVGELLANVLERHAGGTYTLADVVAAGARVDADLATLFEDWIGGTGLPGFVAGAPELYRLPDGPDDESRYQLLLHVANREPGVGFMRVAWDMEAGGERTPSEPVRVAGRSAIEFGAVLSEPPFAVYVLPYLSLNRDDFFVGAPEARDVPSRDAEPFAGVRAAADDVRGDERIFADDLDAGFAIVADGAGTDLRLGGSDGTSGATDAGLPIAVGNQPPRRWSRRTIESSWGRYRHTAAFVAAGDGARRAILPAEIPRAGTWELEIHVPFMSMLPAEERGTWTLEIVSADGRESVTYDATAANVGWNLVGEHVLPAGTVRVELSDATDGRMVVADAVAWSPVGAAGAAAREETP